MSRSIRLLHSSARRTHLVGPSDPVSHLRPVIYDEPAPKAPTLHPYSLREFKGDATDSRGYELLLRLQRQQTDEFNNAFWTESNTRFEAAKQHVLASLPPTASPLDHEHALSEFYQRWHTQEAARQVRYTDQWRRRNASGILLAARVGYSRLKSKIASKFGFG